MSRSSNFSFVRDMNSVTNSFPKSPHRQAKRIKNQLLFTATLQLLQRILGFSSHSNLDDLHMIAVNDYSSSLNLYSCNCFVYVIICLLQTVCASFWWCLITESILGIKGFHKVAPSPMFECFLYPSIELYFLGVFGDSAGDLRVVLSRGSIAWKKMRR
jgi:hypothetical protein